MLEYLLRGILLLIFVVILKRLRDIKERAEREKRKFCFEKIKTSIKNFELNLSNKTSEDLEQIKNDISIFHHLYVQRQANVVYVNTDEQLVQTFQIPLELTSTSQENHDYQDLLQNYEHLNQSFQARRISKFLSYSVATAAIGTVLTLATPVIFSFFGEGSRRNFQSGSNHGFISILQNLGAIGLSASYLVLSIPIVSSFTGTAFNTELLVGSTAASHSSRFSWEN